MNALVLRSAIVAALGGLLFGFDTAVISGTTQQLTRVYELSPGGLGFTVATALLGTVPTGWPSGPTMTMCSSGGFSLMQPA